MSPRHFGALLSLGLLDRLRSLQNPRICPPRFFPSLRFPRSSFLAFFPAFFLSVIRGSPGMESSGRFCWDRVFPVVEDISGFWSPSSPPEFPFLLPSPSGLYFPSLKVFLTFTHTNLFFFFFALFPLGDIRGFFRPPKPFPCCDGIPPSRSSFGFSSRTALLSAHCDRQSGAIFNSRRTMVPSLLASFLFFFFPSAFFSSLSLELMPDLSRSVVTQIHVEFKDRDLCIRDDQFR